jgi:hypothetical protein
MYVYASWRDGVTSGSPRVKRCEIEGGGFKVLASVQRVSTFRKWVCGKARLRAASIASFNQISILVRSWQMIEIS